MPRSSGLVTPLKIGSAVVVVAGVVCAALYLAATEPLTLASIAVAVMLLVVSVALAGALWAIADVLRSDPATFPPEVSRALARMQAQLDTATSRLLEVREQNDRIAQVQQSLVLQHQARHEQPLALTAADLEPLYQAIREIRELSLLTDSERAYRLDRDRQHRRESMVKQAFDLVSSRQWHNAERLVLALESEFPNDHDVSKARNYLDHARRLNEEETVTSTVREVEDLISRASFDPALERARSLVEGFPTNGRARELLHRVQHEREAFYESAVARMFDELRHDIDRRMWRRAFMHAQHLLERFPTHPRADAVRKQLKTLQDNAEIEERQEIEVRIQELIRAQRFEEAIALGEDLIRRYPMSPQAESLDILLPRLRDLAEHGLQETALDEYAAAGDGADIDNEISSAPRS